MAVLGLTTEELVTASHPRNVVGLSVSDPVAAAQALVPELDAQSDLLIVLSHLGRRGTAILCTPWPGWI